MRKLTDSAASAPPRAVPIAHQAPLAAESPSLFQLLIRSVRPRQWTKNLAVFAPLLFAKSITDPQAVLRATLAVVSFCLLAGGIYVCNDWVDREKDLLHPEKRKRPIASGMLSGKAALLLLASCWLAGGAIAYTVGIQFAGAAAGYVLLQILYSLILKRWVILDVVVIALGFVIRVAAGGLAIHVPVSNWLYLCTLLLAVFLGFAKRRHELSSLPEEALSHRENLNEYSVPLLDQMLSVVAASCILAYGLYTVAADTIHKFGSDRLKYTLPFVIYGIFRYLFLIHRRGAGGSPERVLLSDPPMIINLLLYLAVASWALYG